MEVGQEREGREVGSVVWCWATARTARNTFPALAVDTWLHHIEICFICSLMKQ